MNKKTKQKETILKVLRYIKRYWGYVIASILLAGVTVIATLYIPILVGHTVDFIIGPKQVDFARILENIKLMILVIAVTGLAQWLQNVCNNKIRTVKLENGFYDYNEDDVKTIMENETVHKDRVIIYLNGHKHEYHFSKDQLNDIKTYIEGL